MMDTKPKTKILIILISILLITNIVLLGILLMNRGDDKKPLRKNPMTGYLKSEIGFSQEQMLQFDSLEGSHRRRVKKFFDGMRPEKTGIFKQLGADHFSDSAIITAAKYSSLKQMDIEQIMLGHLKEIRDLCTGMQQRKFDTGFYTIMMRPRGDDRAKDK